MNSKTPPSLNLPQDYPTFLEDIKTRIQQSQIKAAISVNQELIKLHWWIGQEISKRQKVEKWGSQVIEKLCKDIQSHFPGLKGFSRSNIFYMRTFYNSYEKVQQAVGQLETPPDFAGQINFYLSAIDDKMRQPGDNPTIGLILCRGKDNLIVEYALRNNSSPITVANFETQLAKALPENLRGTLPTVEEIEAELSRSIEQTKDSEKVEKL